MPETSRRSLRVVITGAGGFLGRNVARRLAARGHATTLVSRRDDAELESLPGSRLMVGAAHELLPALEDLAEHDALVHLASSTNPQIGGIDEEIRQLRELSVLLDALGRAPRTALLYPSSGGTVYGAGGDAPHHEDDPLLPETPYAWGKTAAESLVAHHGRRFGLPYKILRCSTAYGPEQSVEKRQGLVVKVLTDVLERRPTTIWGDGLEVRDYLYVADFCDAVERMLAHPEHSGVYNVGSGTGASVLDVIATISSRLGVRPELRHAPSRAGAPRRTVLDVERAHRVFGWSPATPLADGVERTWKWLRERGVGPPGARACDPSGA